MALMERGPGKVAFDDLQKILKGRQTISKSLLPQKTLHYQKTQPNR